ncbi:hypothetical protein [Herminiimonas contaminans]|uniref:Major facilitator superfamily (MFS) profile domain-containing protein n=1 Tax=Herminiimonas contaminans TaxID=1111140 RepID=A0ABS0ENV5_9BURK|nr:hypothetical protein [Herminiimonas contaminans]MBF8176527.1 hypothetical protein [Herminiimonas contaminans]
MFDGFWSGLFSGLFGPALVTWLGKFRYGVIFLLSMLAVHLGLFLLGVYAKGFRAAVQITLDKTFTLTGIFVPAGIGLLVMFVAFIGSLNKSHTGQLQKSPRSKNENKDD